MNYPEDLKYASNHEWVRVEGGNARMGISDFAQDALGDVVYIELPELGATVNAGDVFSEVESTKSTSDVYAPVSGTIVEVNAALEDAPELVNTDPYGDGWFAVIEMTDPAELEALKDSAAYEASVG